MTDAFRRDSKFVRTSILYEFMRGKPILETYDSFCEVMGDYSIEYREFECWYMRFAGGNYDLLWNESLKPNNLFLLNLPNEIIESIVKKTSWDGVIALRQVSRKLRTIVNNTNIVFQEVEVIMEDFSTTLSIDGESRVYQRLPIDFYDSNVVKRHKNSDYHAFRKLIFLMKNSNIHVEKLYVDDQIEWDLVEELVYERGTENPHCRLMLNDAELHVRTACFCSTIRHTNNIMRALKPGTLKEIEFNEDYDATFAEDTADLDQWKMAKVLKTTGYEKLNVHFEHFVNFVRFDIEMEDFTVRKFVELKKAVLESSNFEKCQLFWCSFEADTDDDDEEVLILDRLEKRLGPHTRKDSNDPKYRQYVIEQENKVFELKIGQSSIKIERKR